MLLNQTCQCAYIFVLPVEVSRSFLQPRFRVLFHLKILTEIFLIYACLYFEETDDIEKNLKDGGTDSNDNLEHFQWIQAFNTCNHWRKVALDIPALWTRIPFRCQEWHDEFMQRASDGPIDIIFVEDDKLTARHNVRRALRTNRVRSISITAIDDHLLFPVMRAPAPLLEAFKFFGQTPISIPRQFLQGIAPKLQIFTAKNVWIHEINLSIFLHITELSLHGCNSRWQTTAHLLDILSIARGLRIMTIEATIPTLERPLEFERRLPIPQRIVYLSQLDRIELEGHSFNQSLAFLNHLDYPRNTKISLSAIILERHDPDLTSFLPYMRGDDVSYVSLQGTECWGRGRKVGEHIHLRTGNTADSCDFQLNVELLKVTGKPIRSQAMEKLGAIKSVIDHLQLEHIHTVSLGDIFIDEKTWADRFPRFTNLHTLRVGGSYAHVIMRLIKDNAECSDSQYGTIFMPILKRLEIGTFRFARDQPLSVWNDVKLYLVARSRIGCPIEEMRIAAQCVRGSDAALIQHLQELCHYVSVTEDMVRDKVYRVPKNFLRM